MATSLGYKVFKTESLDEMPFEQYRVLVAMLNKMNKDIAKDIPDSGSPSAGKSKGKRTTFRIQNEISGK